MKQGILLLNWYTNNKRPLPWRYKSNPYKIWIAEVMLQQTTVQTMIPYYKKFLKKFPNLKSLAQSPLKEVLPFWSGLGYYSRVRNLHQSARLFMERNGKIPKTYIELQSYPGFGPYTARAVSSQAYGEPVSLLDGNVIRVLCRHNNLSHKWWETKAQSLMLQIADQWRQNLPSSQINQSLMELGATICTPTSPSCSICPIKKTCKARKLKIVKNLPIKKLRKKKEIWLWKPQLILKKNQVLLTNQHVCPFLKKQWLLPGTICQLKKKPSQYDLTHTITHHNIYIQMAKKINTKTLMKKYLSIPTDHWKWISLNKVSSLAPFSLLQKIFRLEQEVASSQ